MDLQSQRNAQPKGDRYSCYADVYVEHEAMALDRSFLYHSSVPVEVGSRVKVPFSHLVLTGMVMKRYDEKPDGYDGKILDIEQVLDRTPLLNQELFALADSIAYRTISPLMSVIKTMLPSVLKVSSRKITAVQEEWMIKTKRTEEEIGKLTKKQKEVWNALPDAILASQARKTYSVSILKKLLDLQFLKIESRDKNYAILPKRKQTDWPALQPFQKQALRQIEASTRPVLLHGITGSGKTEVFFHLARKALEQKKQVLILVPEISLTPQMIERVASRFDCPVYAYHSALSDQEAYHQYSQIRNMKEGIVIGTRKAIFLPFQSLGLIIMDEEHDPSYKQDNRPAYHTRDAALFRADYHHCPLVMASATPCLESYARAYKHVYTLVEMKERISGRLPAIHLVDMKNERSWQGLSTTLIARIEERLKRKEQVILLLNRRGFLPVMKCNHCKEVILCPDCGIPLSYHKKENALVCHICGIREPLSTECPHCHHSSWSELGFGTERLEENIASLFPKAHVVRMDADTTTRKNAHRNLLQEFEQQGDILIGTQMVAKGLDFERVTLVGIVQSDVALFRSDYRASESAYAMLEQASGRTGRGRFPGEVLIQTYNPEHFVMQCIVHHQYIPFFEKEMQYRHLGIYSPFVYMATIVFSAKELPLAWQKAVEATRMLESESIQVLGPMEITMRKKMPRCRLLLKCKNENVLLEALWKYARQKHVADHAIKIEVNVNPMNLEE